MLYNQEDFDPKEKRFIKKPVPIGPLGAAQTSSTIFCCTLRSFWVIKKRSKLYFILECCRLCYTTESLWVIVDTGVEAMKVCDTLSQAPEVEPYRQMHFTAIPNPSLLGEVLRLSKEYSQHIHCPLGRLDLLHIYMCVCVCVYYFCFLRDTLEMDILIY